MGLSDKLPKTVKGTDYSEGILTGKFTKTSKPVSAFFFSKSEKGVRTGQYTYLVQKDGSYLLFDNQKDPYQLTPLNLTNIPAEDADLLKAELGKWLKVSEDDWEKEKKFPKMITYPEK